jgi:hypothetical protein
MTAEHVQIHYTGGDETVSLRDRGELDIFRPRGVCNPCEIKQSWCYRPVVWARIQRFRLLSRH